jgi:uncharacterized lipoprotein YddW (UPF0748 family)
LPRYRHTARNLLAIGLLGALGLAGAGCGEDPGPEVVGVEPAPTLAEPAPEPAPRRGLWVLCQGSQRVLDHPDKIPGLIDDARALGVSDLFVQVYRGGRAWFDSSLADPAPYRALRAATGEDTLETLLAAAHAAGLRVHAWVNVLSLARNREAPLVQELGRDAVLVDQHGRSILDYPELEVPEPDRRYYRMGTPAVWIDPAAPGVTPRLAETFAELVTRHPGLDGLHLDYIRYPGVLPFAPGSRFGVGLDFGHGAPTRARFRAETGVEAPTATGLGNANRWDAWRRDQVTELVRRIAATSRAASPGLLLSAAVWSHADRAYLSIGQDWRRWLEEGLLDFAVPMAYTLDPRILRYQAEHFASAPQSGRVWVGVGAWLFSRRPAGAVEQVRLVREAGAAGDALFSWDAIADSPGLRAALAAEVQEAAPGAE